MIPLPDWTRLNPPKLPLSGGSGRGEAAGCLLALGSFPMAIAGAIAGAAGARALLPWLAIPGGILGLIVTIIVLRPTILGGIAQAVFYAGVMFILSGGRESADPTGSWIEAGVVAALFLWATYSKWKNR